MGPKQCRGSSSISWEPRASRGRCTRAGELRTGYKSQSARILEGSCNANHSLSCPVNHQETPSASVSSRRATISDPTQKALEYPHLNTNKNHSNLIVMMKEIEPYENPNQTPYPSKLIESFSTRIQPRIRSGNLFPCYNLSNNVVPLDSYSCSRRQLRLHLISFI